MSKYKEIRNMKGIRYRLDPILIKEIGDIRRLKNIDSLNIYEKRFKYYLCLSIISNYYDMAINFNKNYKKIFYIVIKLVYKQSKTSTN